MEQVPDVIVLFIPQCFSLLPFCCWFRQWYMYLLLGDSCTRSTDTHLSTKNAARARQKTPFPVYDETELLNRFHWRTLFLHIRAALRTKAAASTRSFWATEHVILEAVRTKTSSAACSCTQHNLVREEVRSIVMARDILDVSAAYKSSDKGKEKGNGKWKDKDKEAVANLYEEVTYYDCHRKGRRKRDCRTMEKDKLPEGTTRERRRKGTRPRSRSSSRQATTPARTSMIEMDDRILMISADDREMQVWSIERVMFWSGTAVSVCPLR